MHPQLELLLQIQDLKAQRRELAEAEVGVGQVERLEFHVDVEHALTQLDDKITDMMGGLERPIRSRLEKISGSQGRAVVPLINGTCYGCFTNVPTASLSRFSSREQIHYCENCGRFLYSVES
jgi:predicted  nucleic acid-binding Zn-ribbon protein